MEKEQFEKITNWQNKTFGSGGALPKIAHLEEEIRELKKELTFFCENKDLMTYTKENKLIKEREFADCFILLFGAAASDGMSFDDIVKCIDEKMQINYKRKWGKPKSNGVINHIKN